MKTGRSENDHRDAEDRSPGTVAGDDLTARGEGSASVVGAEGNGQPAPLLVSVRDAAALLGIGRTTAYELIADGELEVVHIRRAARVPMAAIEEYVARLRQRAS